MCFNSEPAAHLSGPPLPNDQLFNLLHMITAKGTLKPLLENSLSVHLRASIYWHKANSSELIAFSEGSINETEIST